MSLNRGRGRTAGVKGNALHLDNPTTINEHPPMNASNLLLNEQAAELFCSSISKLRSLGCQRHVLGKATVLDAGVQNNGSIAAGLLLARLCMADRADVSIVPVDFAEFASTNAVFARTDDPLHACLGGQYAGWPVQTDNFFAMGSGPMRMARGREPMLEELHLHEETPRVVGVLESDHLPPTEAIQLIAEQCGVAAEQVMLAVAPTSSIAGSIQVVARSIETAMHKLHELKFDVTKVVSATGLAPLPPVAKPGDMVSGIGRTNDAMLYGATVTLWVDADDEEIESVAHKVPSESSSDHGRPFGEVFKEYKYDFYQVDPMLFSPAVVILHSLKTGRTWQHGKRMVDVLRQSFLA